ncbi:hypothetical protein L6164_009378 [Bauhinia variegata]|uniref:Uncharacterized protein n=1 Tax=Bauhinia variegata TaxID=167791 RepID=A0ACB9PJX1_BAUVA|nr:hypothetical protein L6164_009378 [Bauhinia variegata]
MEEERTEPFQDGSDLCQELMERYGNSAAPQHRHLLATAAAMQSILSAEFLPLTPPAYFASAISALDTASASEIFDATAVSALSSFLAIDLPLLPPGGIVPTKAIEAVEVLVKLVEREKEGLAVSSVRALVKCLGILLGFSDLEDWDSVKLGFQTLLKFSIDKRPKVRRCAQESLEKVFKSFQSSTVVKQASKLILSVLKRYTPLGKKLLSSRAVDGSKDESFSKPEHLKVLHVLNVLKLTAPCLSAKVMSKVLSEIRKLFSAQFSALTGHVLKTIEAIFEASNAESIVLETETIIVSLASYISLGDKNPLDTLVHAATLLKHSLDILRTGRSSSWMTNLSLVCASIMGLLMFEENTASQASIILKDVLKNHVAPINLSLDKDEKFDGRSQESVEAGVIKSTCTVFENALAAGDKIPNEHILSVISIFFLTLGEISFMLMRNVVHKLADLMTHTSAGKVNSEHLQKCIGSAVFAMGPERFLTLVPITLDEQNFTYSNIWLVPILKRYVNRASLAYYMEHIIPLAKSFKQASRKDSQDLLARANELWGLLPSFCRHATDTSQKFACLSDFLITFLKKNPSMHENVSLALLILVNENKSVLSPQKSESNCYAMEDSFSEFRMLPVFSKEAAIRNMKALASGSDQLLRSLADLFVSSPLEKRLPLKGAIGCLASIADSSVIKEIFVSLIKRFQLLDCEGEVEKLMSHSPALDREPSEMERDSQRCLILELAYFFVEGAKDDLIEIIYNLTIQSFQATNESVHHEAYCTLRRILEEHLCFCSSRYVELIDLFHGLQPPSDIATLRSRLACFHILMVQRVKMSLEEEEEEDTKAFLILNEIILTLKDGNDEARKEACDVLLSISSTLRDSSQVGPTAPYHQLIRMILGYLSGSSPHIKSGAVSALSALVYKDANVCLSVAELVPSLLSLLQTKAVEVVKAVLGFVKVMVSCLQTQELLNFLSDVVTEVLPWSSVSRHHFRSKVTIIFEIIIRKCGPAAIKLVTPEKYKGFLKTVLENRHGKSSATEAATTNLENMPDESSAKGIVLRKPKNLDSQENGSVNYKKKKRGRKFETHAPKSTGDDDFRLAKRTRRSDDKNSGKEKSEESKESKRNRYRGLSSGGKRNVKSTDTKKGGAGFRGSIQASKSHKGRRKFIRS